MPETVLLVKARVSFGAANVADHLPPLSRRCAVLTPELAAELGGAGVTDAGGSLADVDSSGDLHRRFVQPQRLDELQRRKRGRGSEVAIEHGAAHPGSPGEIIHGHGLTQILAKVAQGAR